MAYNKNINYQEEIDKAIANGDYASESRFEKERNEKIDAEGLSYPKTNKYTKLNGESDETYNKRNTPYSQSDAVKQADKEATSGLSNLKNLTSNRNIISGSVWNNINSQFVVPSAVTQADAYLSRQLDIIQSGKTSYSDQVREMLDKITNREKFSYDVDTDPLFQQALASSMNSGKQAMQDTIGQASALTGGYGSTYATTAGNQAYNSFIEDAYDNLPQYYQMAMEAYQMEGDELYRQYGMLSAEDDKEYNRNVTAYDATYQHRNRMYDEAYNSFRDSKSDAFAMANLQINEHGQRVNDAYNYYNAASNYANTQYEREYSKWADEVNLAFKSAEMQNTDWWNQTNFDEGVRRYEQDFAERQREYNESLAFNKQQHDAEMAYKYSALAQDQSQFNAKLAADKAKNVGTESPTTQQVKGAKAAFENQGFQGYLDFIGNLPDDVNKAELDSLVGTETNLGMYYNTYTKENDAFWHIPGGVDKNDTVKDQDGNPIKVKDLPKDLQEEISNAPKGTVFEWDENERKWKQQPLDWEVKLK